MLRILTILIAFSIAVHSASAKVSTTKAVSTKKAVTTTKAKTPQTLAQPSDSLSNDSMAQINQTKNILNEIQTNLRTTQDSLELAKTYLDSLGGLYEKSQDSIQTYQKNDSIQTAELNQVKSQLDSLQETHENLQEDGDTWKQRFLWQLPFTIGLFLIGFGIGGGHFP